MFVVVSVVLPAIRSGEKRSLGNLLGLAQGGK
jgi:hypothetical protein